MRNRRKDGEPIVIYLEVELAVCGSLTYEEISYCIRDGVETDRGAPFRLRFIILGGDIGCC